MDEEEGLLTRLQPDGILTTAESILAEDSTSASQLLEKSHSHINIELDRQSESAITVLSDEDLAVISNQIFDDHDKGTQFDAPLGNKKQKSLGGTSKRSKFRDSSLGKLLRIISSRVDDDAPFPPITPAERVIPPVKYELSDHPKTIKYRNTCLAGDYGTRIHSWGDSLKEAFEQCGMALYSYMIQDFSSIDIVQRLYIEVEADNMMSLLFRFLNELRYLYCTHPFFYCKKLVITSMVTKKCDFSIGCNCFGEDFKEGKHPLGKAVEGAKFIGMHIIDEPKNNKFEICCIIDACTE